MPMDPGVPLTPDERKLVISTLAKSVRQSPLHESNQGFHYGSYTPDFLSALGWPQRRLPDLRGYLETPEAKAALSKTLGWTLTQNIFVSRSQLAVSFSPDTPIDPTHNAQLHMAADRTQDAVNLEYWRSKGLPAAIDSALRVGMTPAEITELAAQRAALHSRRRTPSDID